VNKVVALDIQNGQRHRPSNPVSEIHPGRKNCNENRDEQIVSNSFFSCFPIAPDLRPLAAILPAHPTISLASGPVTITTKLTKKKNEALNNYMISQNALMKN
jgi:hypothetical protein